MKPALLAIVGDGAAGKTASADGIMQLLGPDQVATAAHLPRPRRLSAGRPLSDRGKWFDTDLELLH
jgi:ABC-type glutathione transport system ATPase component